RDPGREAVAAAVRVGDVPGQRRRAERPAGADPAAEPPGRGDDDPRLRLQVTGLEPLRSVLSAPDEHVDRYGGPAAPPQLAGGGNERGTAARRAQRRHVPADEVDGVATPELLPGERSVLARRQQLLAEHRDRPLTGFVDVRKRPALRSGRSGGIHRDAACLELLARAATEIVVGESREQETRPGEIGELDSRYGSASRGLLPRLERVHDLPRLGRMVDERELDPLDVSDNCELHDLTS